MTLITLQHASCHNDSCCQRCKSFCLDKDIKPGIVSIAWARGSRRSKGKRNGILHAREARRAREEGRKGNFRPFFRGFYFLLIACKTLVCVSVLFCFVCFSEKNFIQTNNGTAQFLPAWEYSSEFFVGVCRPVLQILPLFQTKKCHFPRPFSDQTSKIHTRFQTWPFGRNYIIIT